LTFRRRRREQSDQLRIEARGDCARPQQNSVDHGKNIVLL
jgi:hypothetical protein